jgi:transcription termination factor Rho
VARSGTRHTELLLGEGELPVVEALVDALSAQGIEAMRDLRERLTSTQTNYEMLSASQRSSGRTARR